MKQLHVLLPDLFPPREIAAEVCAGLQLPALEKLLARATERTAPADTPEGWLCRAFGVPSVAPVRAAADGLDTGEGYWLCADPVSLQLQRAAMIVIPDVMPGQEAANALCASLNEHFAGQGLRLFAPHPGRWYVQTERETQMVTAPLRQVAWRDAKFHQPQGEDALRWQAIVNEAQMLLHDHPANRVRAARGELAINSLWLWGGGRAQQLNKAFDAVGGDSALGMAFAQVAGVPQSDSLRTMLDGKFATGLWVREAPGAAHQRGDYYAWREAVQQIDHECALLLRALRTGTLRQLSLVAMQDDLTRNFALTRTCAWKVWRTARSLPFHAV